MWKETVAHNFIHIPNTWEQKLIQITEKLIAKASGKITPITIHWHYLTSVWISITSLTFNDVHRYLFGYSPMCDFMWATYSKICYLLCYISTPNCSTLNQYKYVRFEVPTTAKMSKLFLWVTMHYRYSITAQWYFHLSETNTHVQQDITGEIYVLTHHNINFSLQALVSLTPSNDQTQI